MVTNVQRYFFTVLILTQTYFANAQTDILITPTAITCNGFSDGGLSSAVLDDSTFVLDGNITESIWGNALSTSAGAPTPGFGAGHELNALYANASSYHLFLGLAGNVQDQNRILIFIDSKAGGFTDGSFDRTGAPLGLQSGQYNAGNLFDADFTPDYCLTIGTNVAQDNYYWDLFPLQSTAGGNMYLGDTTDPNYGASPLNADTTRGFEMKIPWSMLGGLPTAPIKFMVMYQSDNGFLSNQFLTPADVMQGNYGNAIIDFNVNNPGPIAFNPFIYSWNTGASTAAISGLSAATYTVTITNAKGIASSKTATLINPFQNLAQSSSSNATSQVGTANSVLMQADNTTQFYKDATCGLIANITDAANGISLGLTDAQVKVEPGFMLYNGQPYSQRWFTITPTTMDAASVTLYQTQDDFLDFNTHTTGFPKLPLTGDNADANITNLRVTKVDNGMLGAAGTSCSLINPTSVVWNSATQFWEITIPVTSFSSFFIHTGTMAPLAVALKSFDAALENSITQLNWTTASETEMDKFVVLHKTKNTDAFKKIGTIQSKSINGNSSSPLQYNFQHVNPAAGINYYALELVNKNGTISQSEIKEIYNNVFSSIQIFPNPAVNNLNVHFYSGKIRNLYVFIFDVTGRKLQSLETIANTGNNKIILPIANLPKGTYEIQVTDGKSKLMTQLFSK